MRQIRARRILTIAISFLSVQCLGTRTPCFAAAESCQRLFSQDVLTDAHRPMTFQGFIFSPILPPRGGARPKIWDTHVLRTDGAGKETIEIGEDPLGGFLDNPFVLTAKRMLQDLLAGFTRIHSAYGDRLSEPEKEIVVQSDLDSFDLVNERIGYGVVKRGDHVVGLIRIYDGTQYDRRDESKSLKGMSINELPAERILAKKKIKTAIFETYRRQGLHVFELGKYYLDAKLDAQSYRSARNALARWVLRNYLSSDRLLMKSAVFIIDVGSKAHERAYRQYFGGKPIDPGAFDPPLENGNSIMVVPGDVLRARLLSLIGE